MLVNETLYWIVYTDEVYRRMIVSFDLNLETFDEFPHLQLRSTEPCYDDFLCVMGGCLSALGDAIDDDVSMDMVRSPGVKESIYPFRDLSFRNCKDVVGFTRTGKFFIVHRCRILGIDPRSSSKKYTTLVSFQGSRSVQIANYV